MIRALVALLALIAVALNAPAAMAGVVLADQPMVMAADAPMHDCGQMAKDPCQTTVCVTCHAIPAQPPSLSSRQVAFVVLADERPMDLPGLNPKPEPPRPRR